MSGDLRELSGPELEGLLRSLGEPPWRVGEIRGWLWRRNVPTIAAMSSLPLPLRHALEESFTLSAPAVTGVRSSPDGTAKLVLRLADGSPCETVVIPEGRRLTQCLSSQAGCPLGCTFCQTGRMGFTRNLTAAEIAGQWLAARRRRPGGPEVTNFVFMGMGEPLLNYEAVRDAVGILTAPWGAGISPSRITVSTAGIVPAMARMGREMPEVGLAVSLNAPDDSLRDRLMPVNRKYPLGELVEALRRYPAKRRPVTVEYVLLGGVNDSAKMAAALADLLRGVRCKINLIPFNRHSEIPYVPPSERAVEGFQAVLRRAGYTAPVRRSKGGDIAAACGQLGDTGD